jgi:hypothetical protein
MERTAVVDYLVNVPGAIELWEAGWPYGKRPKLAELIVRMTGANAVDGKLIVDDFNAVVHAEPDGSDKFVFEGDEYGRAFFFGRTKGGEEMSDNGCRRHNGRYISCFKRRTSISDKDN